MWGPTEAGNADCDSVSRQRVQQRMPTAATTAGATAGCDSGSRQRASARIFSPSRRSAIVVRYLVMTHVQVLLCSKAGRAAASYNFTIWQIARRISACQFWTELSLSRPKEVKRYISALLFPILQLTSQVAAAPLLNLGYPLRCSPALGYSSTSRCVTPACIFAFRHSVTMMCAQPPFALFVLADVSTEVLSIHCLTY